MNTNNQSKMSFRELFSLSFIFVVMIAITGMNLVFSDTFGETCGFLHPYIFEAQVSMIDPGGGLNWNSDLTNIPSNESDVRLLDTYLRIYDEKGQVLASDDDAVDGDRGTGSKIDNFSVLESGTVIVEMSSYGDTGSGRFEVTVAESQIDEHEILRLGSAVSGTIYAGETNRVRYPLVVEAGEQLLVRVSGLGENQSELDTYLRLYDPSGTLVNENDDFAGYSSGFIVSNTGETTANYTVEAATYNDASSGRYDLTVENYSISITDGSEIHLDETQSGSLALLQRTRHRISLDSQLNPLIHLEGQTEAGIELPLVLRIYNENEELLTNYDIYGSLDVFDFSVESPSTVILEVGTMEDAIEGTYSLTVSSVNEGAMAAIIAEDIALSEGEAVTVGSQTEGTIAVGERVRYPFTLPAGQAVSIFVDGVAEDETTLDTVLNVYYDGNLWSVSDDYRGLGSGIVNLMLESETTFILEVATYQDSLAGRFTLRLEPYELDVVTQSEASIGQTLSGDLNPDQRVRYPVHLEAGQSLSAFLQASDTEGFQIDTYLRLYDADGNLLTENDDYDSTNFGFSAAITDFTVETASDLLIEVASLSDGATGVYSLYLLESMEDLPEEANEFYGPEIVTVNNPNVPVGRGIAGSIGLNQRQTYPLELAPNQSVILRLTGETIFDEQPYPLPSRLSLYDVDGTLLTESYSYDSAANVLTYSNTKDSSLFVTVEVGSINDYYTGTYELQILENTIPNYEQVFGIQIEEGHDLILEDSPYISAEILSGQRIRHQVDLRAGEIIVANFGGFSRLDTVARVYNEHNALLAEEYSSGRITGTLRFEASEEGEYWIEIGTLTDTENGEYELLVLPVFSGGELVIDAAPVSGDIKPNQRIQYSFYLEAGQTVDISVSQLVPEAAGLSLFSWSSYALSSDANAAQQWVSCLEYYGYVVDSAFRVNEYGISRFVLGTKIDDLCNPLREACQLEATVKLTELGQILLYVLLPGLAIILPVITVLILQNDRVWYWVIGLVVVASFVLTSSLLYVHLGTVSGISALQDFGSGIFGGTATGAAIAFMTKVLENFSERKARQQEEAQEEIRRTAEAKIPPQIKE